MTIFEDDVNQGHKTSAWCWSTHWLFGVSFRERRGCMSGGGVIRIGFSNGSSRTQMLLKGRRSRNFVILVDCTARADVERMSSYGENFDIVFVGSNKTNYRHYYEEGLKILTPGNLILAENAMCFFVRKW